MPAAPVPGGFLALLGERERDALVRAGTQVRCSPGRVLFDEGGEALTLAVLLEGRLKVCTTTREGAELLLAIRGPGDLVGELATLGGDTRTADVVAIDQVRLLVVQLPAFQQLLRDRPEMSDALVRLLVARVRESDQMRIELTQEASVRVAKVLLRLADRFGAPSGDGGVVIDLPLTQEELAGLTSLSRGAVASVLRSLRDDHLVVTARRRIRLLDTDALRGRT